MHLVEPLHKNQLREAYEIMLDYSFEDFLNFCVECGCFTAMQSQTLFDGIVMWEDLEGNYWEEDYDKLMELYDKVGLTREACEELCESEDD
jgi:hypothetical protein